jgi:sec-independent protein translocase protein TatC
MTRDPDPTERSMPLLSHLDELRRRLLRIVAVFAVLLTGSWFVSGEVLQFLLKPVGEHIDVGSLVYIHLTEPFVIYMKASALLATFLCVPYALWEVWSFVSPGLYRHERRWAVPFLTAGTLCFVTGGAFGYYVATPYSVRWLVGLGGDFQAAVTLRSAFQFQSRMMLGMGTVFELPVVIFLLARLGIVTPAFLMRHFQYAVLGIAAIAALITPTGDVLTMTIFAAPMIALYLLGVGVAWLFVRGR